MRIPIPSTLFAAAAIAALMATRCDSGTSAGSGSGTVFTASVEGKAFQASEISIVAQAVPAVPGCLMLLGSQTAGGLTSSITLTLYNVAGPDEYPLGTDMSVYGGIGQVGEGTGSGGDANSWITEANGRAGKVNLTKLSDGRAAGTFEFTTVAGHNSKVGGTRTVANGKFDVPFTGTLATIAPNQGNRVSATLNGKPYNAGTVLGGSLTVFTGGAGVTFSSANSENALSITLEGVTAPDSVGLSNFSPVRLITIGRTGGTAEFCCWQTDAAGTGKIVVTSLTANRVKGRFSGTLKATAGKPATRDLVIENGEFDIGVGAAP